MLIDYKPGVIFTPTRETLRMVNYVLKAYEIFTDLDTLVITSGNDSTHMKGSKHYENNALDFRIWTLGSKQTWAIVEYLNSLYGPDYQFIDERDKFHIHCEWDP